MRYQQLPALALNGRTLIAALLIAGAVPAAAQDFAITDGNGAAIGAQTERIAAHGDGEEREVIRRLAYIVDGHAATHSQATVTLRRGGGGGGSGGAWVPTRYSSTTGGAARGYDIAITDGQARIVQPGARGNPLVQPLAPGLPLAQPDMLVDFPQGAFLTFDPASGRFERREGAFLPFPTAAAPLRELYLVTQDGAMVMALMIMRDPAGTITSVTMPSFGTGLVFTPLGQSDAPEFGSARIDHPMLSAPYDIARNARAGHLRFQFGLPAAIALALPVTAEQAVTATPGGARIDVCPTCGPGLPTDAASLARWTQPTPWLQSDDPAITRTARRARRGRSSDRVVLAELAQIARRRLSDTDFAGHYSASAAWNRRKGDCTEDAVLLAAMARAAGIPALVASGMVYSRERYHGTRDAFIPHSWVVAYADGAWRSVDMTLAGFDSTHIALTLGEGDARSVSAAYLTGGLLEWDSMAEVRARPAE